MVVLPLSKHDAEEGTRQLEGRVYDAAEKVGENRALWKDPEGVYRTPVMADTFIASLDELINRQGELVAALKEQLRQALQ